MGMQLIVHRAMSQDGLNDASTINRSFLERARHLNMTTEEYGFIEEVIDGCCQTLGRVVGLAHRGLLYFSPMRILFRTISSSIFLMKALALGVKNSKLREALHVLDQVISALQEQNHDDAHLKFQYATLLQAQVKRLRGSLVSSQATSINAGFSYEPNNVVTSSESQGVLTRLQDNDQSLFSFEESQFSDFDLNEWLSLPFDASMAPFGPNEGESGTRFDGVDLDLDFLWQLPP